MAEQEKNGITFDLDYWPDLTTNDEGDRYAIEMAEALLDFPPTIHFDLEEDTLIRVSLWEVGGDLLELKTDIISEIKKQCSWPDNRIEWEEEVTHITQRVERINKIVEALTETKQYFKNLLDDYQKKKD